MSKKKTHKFENNKKYWFTAGLVYRRRGDLVLKDSFGYKKRLPIRTIKISGNGIEIELIHKIKNLETQFFY